jgi:hypothetical protein
MTLTGRCEFVLAPAPERNLTCPTQALLDDVNPEEMVRMQASEPVGGGADTVAGGDLTPNTQLAFPRRVS